MTPKLDSATFNFSQEGNCIDKENIEFLEIRCESSLGIDNDGGCFYILKTDGWSIDSFYASDEEQLRCKVTIKYVKTNNTYILVVRYNDFAYSFFMRLVSND